MKLIPFLTALLVTATLYMVVFERERLMEFAATNPLLAEQTADAATTASTETSGTAADPVATEAADDAVKVFAIHSVSQTIDSAVVLRGQTEAAREVTVAAETSGLVVSEPLRKGSFVEEGDVMCRLDPGTREVSLAEARARLAEAEGRVPEAEAGVTEANARLREAEINVNAAQKLSEEGFASETRLINAEAQLESALAGVQRATSGVTSARAGIQSAQAAVAAAEREIERLAITAPFSGLLETDSAELGTLMQPGAPCATIIQLDQIKLVGFVPESDFSKITVGATAGARLSDGHEVVGQVTFLSRSADELTRTFRVEVTVDNSDLTISDGQTAEIIVAADGRQAHLLAQSTLTLDDEGALGVRTIADDNTVRFMPVTLLRDTAEGVWVADLPERVDIITVGQEFVVDGVRVAPTFQEAKG